jgi:hypothetical protein
MMLKALSGFYVQNICFSILWSSGLLLSKNMVCMQYIASVHSRKYDISFVMISEWNAQAPNDLGYE